MSSMTLTSTTFLYMDTDVPAGQTLAEWRRRSTRRPLRRRFSWLPNLRPRS